MLWDKIEDLKTYYVTRDTIGSTRVAEISVEKLARDLVTSQELLCMRPSEVLSKYAVGDSDCEETAVT